MAISRARLPPGLAINAAASADLDPDDRVAAANRAIREEVARQPDLEGMGTTLTLVELAPEEDRCAFGHVGDSRAYLYRDGELRQLTEDHTVAAEYVALGHISAEETDEHPQSHMLTRCLGLTRFVNVDRSTSTSTPVTDCCCAPTVSTRWCRPMGSRRP